jgi:hypothetical protein
MANVGDNNVPSCKILGDGIKEAKECAIFRSFGELDMRWLKFDLDSQIVNVMESP